MITMGGLQFLLVLSSISLSLSVLYVSVSADVFTSLNCGSSTTITDGNFIVWTSDSPYIQNGENHVVNVPSTYAPNIMNTLRAFTTRKTNCYSFKVDKGSRIILRPSFYYGNYDKKSSPPSFDMHFDGNYWGEVETSNTDVVYYDIVYVVKGNHAHLCLSQTKPDQFPFISALEIRSMEAGVYSHSDYNKPLYLINRFNFGGKDIRFPYDSYDRIWLPVVVSSSVKFVTSNATVISTSNINDSPPIAVLRTAMTPSSSSASIINIGTGIRYTTPVPILINMYYSEVTQLDSTEKRSFQTSVNGNIPATEPVIIPPYGGVVEMYIDNMTATSSTTLALVSTSDSTLPPLINAMEVFMVGSTLSEGTDSNDVEALVLLQNSFTKLQEWSGDPCLPSQYTWDWVACSSDPIPRVTSLLLSNLGLVGTLPDFSDMDSLEIIELNKNSMSGAIPDFLGTFPKLKELNLADNSFSGTVPSSISQNKNIKLDISGNPNLCTSGESCKKTPSGTGSENPSDTTPSGTGSTGTSDTAPSGTSNKKYVLLITLATVIPAFVLVVIVGSFVICCLRKKAATPTVVTGHPSGMPGVPLQTMPTAGPTSNTSVHPGMYPGQVYQHAPSAPTSTTHQAYYQDVPSSYSNQGSHRNIPPPPPSGDYGASSSYTGAHTTSQGY